jgi:SAM-dependent methyltransferase
LKRLGLSLGGREKLLFVSGEKEMNELKYGNWIRIWKLWLTGGMTIVSMVAAALPLALAFRIMAGLLGLGSLISFLLPMVAYRMFSQKGGNFQEKVFRLITNHLDSHGNEEILDVGTGNGILAIMIARENPEARVTGVDAWGKDWEYSKSVCEENARSAEVAERVQFSKGTAAALNFPDNSFDGVVSNLTFHEVKIVKQKSSVMREALRVVKPGGSFVFIDYFYDEKFYGKLSDFQSLLQGLRVEKIELQPLQEVLEFPGILRHPRIFGKVGIIQGKK